MSPEMMGHRNMVWPIEFETVACSLVSFLLFLLASNCFNLVGPIWGHLSRLPARCAELWKEALLIGGSLALPSRFILDDRLEF